MATFVIVHGAWSGAHAWRWVRPLLRAAIINGGGATDFCARFLDEKDKPITGLKVSIP